MKAALIGAGHIARQHLACLRELPGVEVVGVCDLSPGDGRVRRRAVRRARLVHRLTARCSTQTRPDVVHVTTPPTSHYPLAMAALDAGAHVILEKPATVTFDQLDELWSPRRREGSGAGRGL